MAKTKSNSHMSAGDTKVLYKKSVKITTSYSSYATNLSSILSITHGKRGAAFIRKLQSKKSCNRGGKLMRDISIETEVCKLRSYFKNKKKCILKRSTSGTSKFSAQYSTKRPRRKNIYSLNQKASNPYACLKRHALVRENLKHLFLEWVQTHEACHEYDKRDAEKVVDLIMHNLKAHASHSSRNSSQETMAKLKKFLKFFSSDSSGSNITSSKEGKDRLSKKPRSRCTYPNCMTKNSNPYKTPSTLSVPKHIAIEKFCEPNKTTQQLYSVWISRQASRFYTDSSSLNYSVFSSESLAISACGKKRGARYMISKVQFGEQSLPVMAGNHSLSHDSLPYKKQECIVFLGNTTNITKGIVSNPPNQPKINNREVYIYDESDFSTNETTSESAENTKIISKPTFTEKDVPSKLPSKNRILYEAAMIYKINNQIGNEADMNLDNILNGPQDLPANMDVISNKSDEQDCSCKKCKINKPNFCERATSDMELSLDVSKEKHKIPKKKFKTYKRQKKEDKSRKKTKPDSEKHKQSDKTDERDIFKPSKFISSFGKLRHKNSNNFQKLLRKTHLKSPKSKKESLVDPVEKLIQDMECIFRKVTNKDDDLKIDIKINVLKKPTIPFKPEKDPVEENKHKKLVVSGERGYPNKRHVDELKREISTKQLILYENQQETLIRSSGDTSSSSRTSNTMEYTSATYDSGEFTSMSTSDIDIKSIKTKCQNDSDSKLPKMKSPPVPKIIPLLDTNATSKTMYLLKHSVPNLDFFENKNQSTLYQVVNNMNKNTSVQEISAELKELRLVLNKLAATASKLVASHANKVKQQQAQSQLKYLSTGTEAPTQKSRVKSIRLMTTRETQKSKTDTLQQEVNTEPALKTKHSQTSCKKSVRKDSKKKDVIVKNLRLIKKSTSYNIIESETILKVTDMTSAANRSLKKSADATVTYLYRKSNSKPKQMKGHSNSTGYYYEGVVNRLKAPPKYVYDVCNFVPSCILSKDQKLEYYYSSGQRDKKYTSYFLQTLSVPSFYGCNPISLFSSDPYSACRQSGGQASVKENLWDQVNKSMGNCDSNTKSSKSCSTKTDCVQRGNEDQYDSSKNCVNVRTLGEGDTTEIAHNNEITDLNSHTLPQTYKCEAIDATHAKNKCINKISSTRIDIEDSQLTKRTPCRCFSYSRCCREKLLYFILFWFALITILVVFYYSVIKPFTDTMSKAKTHPTVIEIVTDPTKTKGANAYNISHIYVNDELRNLTNVYVQMSDLGF